MLRMEKQIEVNIVTEVMKNNAFAIMAKGQTFRREGNRENEAGSKKKDYERKEDKYCGFSKITWHDRDTYFKINGYPD